MAPKPILYSLPLSPPVRTVWMTAKIIGLELENINVDIFKGEQFCEAFLKKNPDHTIPLLEDDGEIITEGSVICTYLIAKYGPKECSLYPTDLLTRTRIDERLYYNAAILFPRVRDANVAAWVDRVTKMPEKMVSGAFAALDRLVTYLEGSDFLVGNSLTLADLAVATTVTNLEAYFGMDKIKYAKVVQWLNRVAEAFPEYTEIDKEPLDDISNVFRAKLAENAKKKNAQ